MLNQLTERLSGVVKKLRGQTRLTEANTTAILREVRIALLEADVALNVVKTFIEQVKTKAMGEKVQASLSPSDALVGVVHEELAILLGQELGEDDKKLHLEGDGTPAVLMLVGLQGVGKTTTVAKLARYLIKQKKTVVLTSCDVYRPAAADQLKTLAKQVEADYVHNGTQDMSAIFQDALAHAKHQKADVLIVDTAGRLNVDDTMMEEMRALHNLAKPCETLFVADAMQGQEAANVAKAFGQRVPLTGLVLTKMDADTRGGAALSVVQVTQKPIKFSGVSEKIDGLQPFNPDQMAKRILGMDDIVAAVEAVKRDIDEDKAKAFAKKMQKGGGFDLNDFLEQTEQMNKMGGVGGLLAKLPAGMVPVGSMPDEAVMEKQMRRTRGMIHAMTPKERLQYKIIKASRKRRIAQGAGVTVQELNRLLKQFEQMRGMTKRMGGAKGKKGVRAFGGMF